MRIERCASGELCTQSRGIKDKPSAICKGVLYYEIGDDGYIKRRICKRCGLNEAYTYQYKHNIPAFGVNHRLDSLYKHAKHCKICSPEQNPIDGG